MRSDSSLRRAGGSRQRVNSTGRSNSDSGGLASGHSGSANVPQNGQARPHRPQHTATAQYSWLGQNSIGDLSTASLLLAGANRFSAQIAPLAGPLTGIGSVGLGIHSVRQLTRARTMARRLDAAHGIAWSLQGVAGLGKLLRNRAAWLDPTATGLGVAGGAIQTVVGGYRVASGWKQRDRERVVLGSLDVGAGLCWAASTCAVANPYTLGGFAALTGARMVYANRDHLKALGGKMKRGAGRKLKKAGRALKRAGKKLSAPFRRKSASGSAAGSRGPKAQWRQVANTLDAP